MFTNERLGRMAMGTILAVIGGIVLQGICSDPIRAIACWLLYVVVVAIAINSERCDEMRALAVLAILPAITPLIVLAYPVMFLNQGVCISGVRLTREQGGLIAGFCVFFAIVSWLAITLFAFARNSIVSGIGKIADVKLAERLTAFDKVLRTGDAVVGSVGLLYLALVGSS